MKNRKFAVLYKHYPLVLLDGVEYHHNPDAVLNWYAETYDFERSALGFKWYDVVPLDEAALKIRKDLDAQDSTIGAFFGDKT